MNIKYYRGLFFVSALYDFILGVAFVFFYQPIFSLLNMNVPGNPAYLTFCALMIALFGVLLFMIFLKIEGSRRLVLYSIGVKFIYIGTVIYYYLLVGHDYVDLPFIIFAGLDFIFACLFIESLRFIKE
ncbi:MAG: hypothetical protein NTU76_03430 [Candidatus Taylorbacteria bacterium]|nr:hypothetical protein [Candidatus Taylorbacteria bacterium]